MRLVNENYHCSYTVAGYHNPITFMFNSLQRRSNFFPTVIEHPNLALKEYTPSEVIGAIRKTSLQDTNVKDS